MGLRNFHSDALVPVLDATLRPALYAASINPIDALRAE